MLPRVGTQAQAKLLTDRGARSFEVKGRLKPGVGLAQAGAEMTALASALEQEHPETDRQRGIKLLTEIRMRQAQSPPNTELAFMLMGVAALVLIIACANVANLLLSRARARSREITVRLAIGAGRRHLLAQLLTESLVLGLAGGAVSLLFANAVIDYLSRTPFATDLPISITVQLDRRALLFSLAASLASVVLFGLGPALRSSRANVALCLKTGEANPGGGRFFGRSLLVVAQVALSLMLLSCATLFYQSFREVLLGSPGFRTDHLLLLSFDPALVRYTPEKAGRFYRELVADVRKLPGVRNAALTRTVPFGDGLMGKEIVPEDKQLAPGKTTDSIFTDIVGDRYFETIGTSLQDGRGFLPTDTADSPRVAVINRVLADRYWPKQSAVGKRFRLDGPTGPQVQIVGVAQTARYVFVGEGPLAYLYLPLSQNPTVAMTLLVETAGDAASLAEPVRQVAHSLDRYQPVFNVRTMRDFYQQRAVRVMQMIVVVVGVMGLLGLTLALVGLYGLVSYSVSRRTREIGIRMAVGAQWRDILRMVLRQGLVLAGMGIGIGIVGSYGVIHLLAALYSQTSAGWVHPWGFAAMLLAVFAITMLACYIPARRAATIDANRALHWD